MSLTGAPEPQGVDEASPTYDRNLQPLYAHVRGVHAELLGATRRKKRTVVALLAWNVINVAVLLLARVRYISVLFVLQAALAAAAAVVYIHAARPEIDFPLEQRYLSMLNSTLAQFHLRLNPSTLQPELPRDA